MEVILISLGGSVIVPDRIDVGFLKKFRKLILKQKNRKFVVVCGGGKTCRRYQKAASEITKTGEEDLDWLGIHATRLNAHLLRTVFGDAAHKKVISGFREKIVFREKILVASGWKPGCSTDYDAVMLAKNLGVKKIINISNIDCVYDKNPKKFRKAKPLSRISWKEFRKMVGSKWSPGMNMPFDPVASREAQKSGAKVFIVGKSVENLGRVFSGRSFRGTVIS